MALLEKQTANAARRYHPKAQMWVSPQSFNQAVAGRVLRHPEGRAGLARRRRLRPAGPRAACPSCGRRCPTQYPIRHYPDITHSLQCQYPVPDWDVAYALTEGREVINPRPAGRGDDLSRCSQTIHDRLPHLLRRLQRRRQQDRLERAGLGPGRRRDRHPARVRPLLHRRPRTPTASPRGCWRWSGTGAGRC